MSYNGSEKRTVTKSQVVFCEDCGCQINEDEFYFVLFYDCAFDADDGYVDFDEHYVCQSCFVE